MPLSTGRLFCHLCDGNSEFSFSDGVALAEHLRKRHGFRVSLSPPRRNIEEEEEGEDIHDASAFLEVVYSGGGEAESGEVVYGGVGYVYGHPSVRVVCEEGEDGVGEGAARRDVPREEMEVFPPNAAVDNDGGRGGDESPGSSPPHGSPSESPRSASSDVSGGEGGGGSSSSSSSSSGRGSGSARRSSSSSSSSSSSDGSSSSGSGSESSSSSSSSSFSQEEEVRIDHGETDHQDREKEQIESGTAAIQSPPPIGDGEQEENEETPEGAVENSNGVGRSRQNSEARDDTSRGDEEDREDHISDNPDSCSSGDDEVFSSLVPGGEEERRDAGSIHDSEANCPVIEALDNVLAAMVRRTTISCKKY